MDESSVELQTRAGSFLPEHVPIGRKQQRKRRKQMTETMIQRHIAHYEKINQQEKEKEIKEQKVSALFQRMMLELFIWRFERLYMRLPHMLVSDPEKLAMVSSQKLPKQMEFFVAYLLHVLQARGDVVHYGWYEMYKEGKCIDGLGVDQWCLLAPKHGGFFCAIDTKSSRAGVASQRKKNRGIICAFYPGMNLMDKLTETEVQRVADRLLSELKLFFIDDPMAFAKSGAT